jgi:6,7-dimethyl-8-ribityllumazine synthase
MSRRRIAIAVSRFNRAVTDNLLEGALEACRELDVDATEEDVFPVPGAFELPLIAQQLARSGEYDGIACLGAVVRGETPHFDYVCDHAAAGILRVSLENEIPVAFGVLTTETIAQALARAGGEVGNKGYEAVHTIIDTLDQLARIEPRRES